MKKLLTLIFFIPFTCIASGTIHYAKNKVWINNTVAKKGDAVNVGDVIKTAESSLTIVRFNNDSTIKVPASSSVKLTQFNLKERHSKFQLIHGSGFFKLKPKSKGKLNVYTKNLAMGVRGTLFFVSYGQKNKKDVYMCVKEGAVAAKARSQKGATLVKAGQGIVQKDGKTPTPPQFLPWTTELSWSLEPGAGKLENDISIEEGYSNPLEKDYD